MSGTCAVARGSKFGGRQRREATSAWNSAMYRSVSSSHGTDS